MAKPKEFHGFFSDKNRFLFRKVLREVLNKTNCSIQRLTQKRESLMTDAILVDIMSHHMTRSHFNTFPE